MSLEQLIVEAHAGMDPEEAAHKMDEISAYRRTEARKKFIEDHGEEVADTVDNTVERVRQALAGIR